VIEDKGLRKLSVSLVTETSEGPSKHGDEISVSIKTGEFMSKLRLFCMLKGLCSKTLASFYLVVDNGKCIVESSSARF
jgi:hypothetical protein